MFILNENHMKAINIVLCEQNSELLKHVVRIITTVLQRFDAVYMAKFLNRDMGVKQRIMIPAFHLVSCVPFSVVYLV
jgi:hypothetical protein